MRHEHRAAQSRYRDVLVPRTVSSPRLELAPSRRGGGWRSLLLVALLVLGLGAGVPVLAQQYSADGVKAAFLYRFAAYVEWPADAAQEGPFVIGVAASDGVFERLQALLQQRLVQGRPAEARRVASVEQVDGLHILLVGDDGRPADALLEAAATRPILTVTDGASVPGRGVINFVRVGPNVRFEVSLRAAERHRLRIAAGLLSVAVRVDARAQGEAECRLQRAPRREPGTCGPVLAADVRRRGGRS